ncbi:MAG: hypothetical protein ABEJ93_04690 [Candidatus Nanohalobium sp.]
METSFDRENIFDSVVSYRVLRRLRLEEETYAVQINLKDGIEEDKAREVKQVFDSLGIVEPVPDSDPQLYEIRYEGLIDKWYGYWKEELGEAPLTPEDFDEFLEEFIKSFMDEEENSTVREMLLDRFYESMKSFQVLEEGFSDNSLEELEHQLEEKYENKKIMHEHVKEALRSRS